MLNLDSAVQRDGLTLFQDFSDPNRYYYLPGHPALARAGGEPLFQLLLYREAIDPSVSRDQDRGGGFLTMTVDLRVPQAKLDALRSSLPGDGGEIELAPVPFESGRVRITALGSSAGSAAQVSGGGGDDAATPPGFVEEILGSVTPGLYGDNRAVFSLELSTKGAVLMAASLMNDGASSIAVVYELDYEGLKPARDLKIVIEADQVYEYLHSKTSVSTLWFKSNIDTEMEELTKRNLIRIEDVDYLETLDTAARAKREKELQDLAKELAQWTFFKPGLEPGQVLAKDRGELTIYDPTTDAARFTDGFSTPLQTAATGRGDTGDTDGPRLQGKTALQTVTRVSGSAPPARAEGAAGVDRPLTAVERWNLAGRPQAGFLLRTMKQSERTRISFSMSTVSAHRRTVAPQGSIALISGDSDLPGRIVKVDLDSAFFQTVEGSVTTNARLDEAGVSSMAVSIRYGFDEDGRFPKDTVEFVLDEEGQEHAFRFWMDERKTTSFQYKVEVRYRADYAIGAAQTRLSTEWIDTEVRNLDIDPRVVQGLMPVRLTAGEVSWDEVSSIQTRVDYRDAATGVDASRTVILTRSSSSALVPIRPAPGSRAYTVSASYFFVAGGSETVELAMDGNHTVVLNQPPSRSTVVRVVLADPLQRLREATVELLYSPPDGGPEQTSLLRLGGGLGGGQGSDQPSTAQWTFSRPSVSDEVSYRYRVTLFGAQTVDKGPWQHISDRMLVIGDVFPGLLEVHVEMIGDLAEAGFAIARLSLDYDGSIEGADTHEERTVRGAFEPFTWRVPSATSVPGPFRYRIEYFRADRTSVVEEAEVSTENLLLWVPRA